MPEAALPVADNFKGQPGFRHDKPADYALAKPLLKDAGVDVSTTRISHLVGPPSIYRIINTQSVAIVDQIQAHPGWKIDLVVSTVPGTPDNIRKFGYSTSNVRTSGPGTFLIGRPIIDHFYSTSISENLWNDKRTDQLIDAERAGLDPAKRAKDVQDIQRYLTQPPVFPVAPIVRNFSYWELGRMSKVGLRRTTSALPWPGSSGGFRLTTSRQSGSQHTPWRRSTHAREIQSD